MSESFDFAEPERVTVGTEGAPGRRMFFLQVRQAATVVTLKIEKLQVAALATWIATVLEDLPALAHLPEDLEPEVFLTPAWTVGSIAGSYDADADRVMLVLSELVAGAEDGGEEDEPDDGASARILATREQLAALAIRATRLVESGRPPCPLCGYPLEATGHQCPRTNGYRPPTL